MLFYTLLFVAKAIIYSRDQTSNIHIIVDFYSEQLDDDLNFYIETGYVSVGDLTKSENRLFYSLYLKENTLSKGDMKQDDDFILWIYGGPGCSSQDSNFNENGPIWVDDDQELHLRETTWNKLAHIMYVDQPFGTGLSYWTRNEIINNSWDAADYVIDLLTQFYKANPQFLKTKLHIWGESYGGHYIPVLAEKIKLANLFNLHGIGIGGAWSHPKTQVTPTVAQLLNYGVIDQLRFDSMMKYGIEALNSIDDEEYEKFLTISDEEIFFSEEFIGPNFRYNIQIYDYDDGDQYEEFINDNMDVFDAPENITFIGCNQDIYMAFAKDQTVSVLPSIEYLLKSDIKVFVYHGQLDTVVSSTGVELWINQLEWEHLPLWKKSKKQSWAFVNPLTGLQETGGTIKSFKNLHFVMVYKAGHMTPTDQPEASFQMLKNYFQI